MSDQSTRRKLLREEPMLDAPVGAFAAVRSGDATMGQLLREYREVTGASLDEVADALRIRKSFLEALEDNRIDDLPGQAYAIGFVRSYAEALGFDGEEAVEVYKHELSGEGRKATLVFPEPMPESRIPKGGILFVSVILAAAAYGTWYYLNEHDVHVADLVPQVPTELSGGDTASAAPAGVPAPRIVPAPTPAAPAPVAETDESRPAAPESAPKSEPAPTAAAGAPEGAPGDSAEASQPPASVTETPRPVPPRVAEIRQRSQAEAEAAAAAAAAAAPTVTPTAPERTTATANQSATGPAPAQAPGPGLPGSAAAPSSSAPAAPATGAGPQPRGGAPEEAGNVTVNDLPGIPPPAPAEASDALDTAPPPPETVSGGEGAASAPADTARAAPGDSGQVATAMARIEVRAKADSWIQVRSESGALLMTRILRAGDTYVVPRERGLSLMTGNAGALEILVDGQPVPSIGPFGAVRRGVALDAARLRAGTAAAP